MRIIQVKTKDCSPSQEQQQQQQPQHQRITRDSKTDSFTLYSDDSIRLKKLLLKDVDDEEFDLDEFASRHYSTDRVNLGRSIVGDCNPQEASYNRKTRISFEVHPSLLLEEEFLYGDNSSSSGDDGLDPLESLLLDDDDSELRSLIEALGLVNSRR